MFIVKSVFIFIFLASPLEAYAAALYLGEAEKWNLKSSEIIGDSLTLSGEKVIDKSGDVKNLNILVKKLNGSDENIAAAIDNLPELAIDISSTYADKCVSGTPEVMFLKNLSVYYFSCETKFKLDGKSKNTHVIEGVFIKSGYLFSFTFIGAFSKSDIEENLSDIVDIEIK